MRIVRRLFWLAVFVAALVIGWRFAHANGGEVSRRLPGRPGRRRPAVAAAAAGVRPGRRGRRVALCLVEMARLGLLSRRYRKALGRLEEEVHQLRDPFRSAAPRRTPRRRGLEAAEPESRREDGAGYLTSMGWFARAFRRGGAPTGRDADVSGPPRSAGAAGARSRRGRGELLCTQRASIRTTWTPIRALARLYRQQGEFGRAIQLHQNLLLRRDLDAEQRIEVLGELAEDFRKAGFLRRATPPTRRC